MLLRRKPLSASPLLAKQEPLAHERKAPMLGLLLVTSAALLFGVVAACVKAIEMPTLVLQLCRSFIEWALGVGAALFYWRTGAARAQVRQEAEVEVIRNGGYYEPPTGPTPRSDPDDPEAARSASVDRSGDPPSSLALLLIGPAHLRGWLVLRALLYWLFLACWWFALAMMPIGDATTIVYIGPIFTATFAYLFLGESIDWTFYPIAALDAAGLLLITQPTFIFGSGGAAGAKDDGSYYIGALSSFVSAVVAGLLPICTRKSKACFWTAVNHCSSALSALVFTPIAIGIWFMVDPGGPHKMVVSLGELLQPEEFMMVRTSSTGADGAEAIDWQIGRWPLLLGATVTGFVGLALQTLGYQLEEAARASLMTVLEIPFAYVLQYALFREPMTPLGLCGVGLVICGTVLNLIRRLQLK